MGCVHFNMRLKMNKTDVFNAHRNLLFSIAYRMTGSVMDAEDMVQDTWLKWDAVDLKDVARPKAFLTTMISRSCIDYLRSARLKRTDYVGPWLPEPLAGDDAADDLALSDSLSMAFLMLLENLSPVERAIYILRVAFVLDYDEIAGIVDKSAANCRQILRRAREKLDTGQGRRQARRAEHESLLSNFMKVCEDGNLDELIALMSKDIVLYSDGGGKVVAALRPLNGAENVARFLLGILKKAPADLTVRIATLNGSLSVLAMLNGKVISTMSLAISDGKIEVIHIMRNPDKLRHLQGMVMKIED